MNVGEVIETLKDGKFVARRGWNANHKLGLQKPDENSANTLPYVYMIVGSTAQDLQGQRVPWVCSQTDMLAVDWQVVE